MNSQWVVLIDPYPRAISSNIIQNLEYVGGDKKGWDVSQPKGILTSYFYQKVIGCLFAQGLNIPNENARPEPLAIKNNRGFIPGILGGNRDNYGNLPLVIEFRETNTSFMDMVIRPWVILASHYGFVARQGGENDLRNIKSTITILQYTRSFQKISQIPRKVWTFYNCVPTQISDQSLSYSPDTEYEKYQTFWTYTNYTVHSNLYLALPNIINRISTGTIPNVSPFQQGNSFTTGNLPNNIAGFF
ncbi:MAG: hypothetical protein EBU90_31540 [Proteobacteria bacterium]|nr:hypothetical protein [Pseudomonadota bacterium]